jgi:hypothetical protein
VRARGLKVVELLGIDAREALSAVFRAFAVVFRAFCSWRSVRWPGCDE